MFRLKKIAKLKEYYDTRLWFKSGWEIGRLYYTASFYGKEENQSNKNIFPLFEYRFAHSASMAMTEVVWLVWQYNNWYYRYYYYSQLE